MIESVTRIHHIGVAVRDIAVASREMGDHFGYRSRSPLIHDSIQTAFARFLLRDGEAAYLELVSPDGPQSRLVGALKRGGGLNHLCWITADIDGACRRLSSGGMVVVQEPVPAVAFPGRRIAWLMGAAGVLTELLEDGPDPWMECHEPCR